MAQLHYPPNNSDHPSLEGKQWNPVETWYLHGEGFTIEVNHWTFGPKPHSPQEENWCLYIHVRPEHQLFHTFVEERDYFYERSHPINAILSGGCTFNQWKYNKDGIPTSKQIGCDYQHVWDDEWRQVDIIDQHRVLGDAYDLFIWASEYEAPTPEPPEKDGHSSPKQTV